jgi:uncharacterized protein (TIGR02996 family)
MPPPGYEPFLRAICENPQDDTVRLAYADWLTENGDEKRAEFIRVQVERARLRAEGQDSDPLRTRDLELRAGHGVKWQHELPRLRGVSWQRFWRGFVSGATVVTWQSYDRRADSLFAATPIQFLTVSRGFGTNAERFAASKYLTQLIGLTILDVFSGWEAYSVCQTLPPRVLEWVEVRLPPSQELAEHSAQVLGSAVCFRKTATRLRVRGEVPTRAAAALRAALGDRVSWCPAAEPNQTRS